MDGVVLRLDSIRQAIEVVRGLLVYAKYGIRKASLRSRCLLAVSASLPAVSPNAKVNTRRYPYE